MRLAQFSRHFLLSAALVGSLVSSMACQTGGAQSGTGNSTSSAGGSDCDKASFNLKDDDVVGQINGKNITVKDLGKDFAARQKSMLRSYCDGINEMRKASIDNYVDEQLIDGAMKAASFTGKREDFLRSQVEKASTEPTAEEMKKFYDENAGPGAPPMEAVLDQIKQILQGQQKQKAAEEYMKKLRDDSKVALKVPEIKVPVVDIRPSATTPVVGAKGAKVYVVEFADFECPYCSTAAQTFKTLKDKYGDKVEFSFRHFPLRQIHRNAQKASEYAYCAGKQGKFWETYYKFFENQQDLGEEKLKEYATAVGVDPMQLAQCVSSPEAADKVNEDYSKGEEAGVRGTPSFFINGKAFQGNPSPEAIGKAIDEALKG